MGLQVLEIVKMLNNNNNKNKKENIDKKILLPDSIPIDEHD